MTMLIAKTVLHRTIAPGKPADKQKGLKAVPPKTEEIQPGEIFEAKSDAERIEWISMGAADVAPKDMTKDSVKRGSTSTGTAAKGKPGRKPGPKPKAADTDADAGKGEGDDGSKLV